MPGGLPFVEALQRAWDDGDAVLPVDIRLPRPAIDRLLASMRLDEPVEDGDALVVATSGTSGEPKGVVLTHAAIAASAMATSERLGVDPQRDRWLACLPLAHVGGLSVVTRALATGTPLVVHDGFDATAVSRAAASDGVTLVSLVATALRRVDASRFRVIVLGGTAPPDDVPPNAVTTYGMTETGSGVVYDGVPLDGVDVRVEPSGEILVRGPMLLRAYRDGTDPKDADGWFATGDLGEIDSPSGRLRVFGRAGDLIITGGENVWPEPVEAIPSQSDPAWPTLPSSAADREWGQRCRGDRACRLEPSAHTRRALPVKEHIGPWAAPRAIELVDSDPHPAPCKVRRRAL